MQQNGSSVGIGIVKATATPTTLQKAKASSHVTFLLPVVEVFDYRQSEAALVGHNRRLRKCSFKVCALLACRSINVLLRAKIWPQFCFMVHVLTPSLSSFVLHPVFRSRQFFKHFRAPFWLHLGEFFTVRCIAQAGCVQAKRAHSLEKSTGTFDNVSTS